MNKPVLHLQQGLFGEEEENPDYLPTIQKHFDVCPVDKNYWVTTPWKDYRHFRGSIQSAGKVGYHFQEFNCLNYVPHFRNLLIDPTCWFNDLGYFANQYDWEQPLFLRPVSAKKPFAGQVFKSKERFLMEYEYLTVNQNFDDSLMCLAAKPTNIFKEYRLVYVNHKFISVCQYMEDGILSVKPVGLMENKLREFGAKMAANPYLLNHPDFCVDLCFIDLTMKLRLIELNSIQCSSFYSCDLDACYKALAERPQF